MAKYKANYSGAPNFAYDLCVQHITEEEAEKMDLSSLTMLYNGSEPIRSKTLDVFLDYFKVSKMKSIIMSPCYGMAETTLIVSTCSPSDAHTALTLEKETLHHGLVQQFKNKNNEALPTVTFSWKWACLRRYGNKDCKS